MSKLFVKQKRELNMKNQMTSKERILASINLQETDRIATDYWGVPEITAKLYKHFHVDNMLDLAKALDIDYIVELQPALIPPRTHMWDLKMKKIPILNGLGYYEEPENFPLRDLETIEEIDEKYNWPTTDMFDYSVIEKQVKKAKEYGFATQGGYISLTYFYEMIRGTEEMFLDMAADPEIAEHILMRLNEFAGAHVQKIFEAANGDIDMSQVTDDFGAQSGLLMSVDYIDKYLGKYYSENIARVKSFGAKVFHHDDGSMMQALPWLVEKGIDILNPLQWHLPGWDIVKLKQDYGKRLCFHSGIDNQDVLPFGTVQDVVEEVHACMDALYTDKTGYILGPCHNLQAMTPLENIFTMYEEARKYSENFK